VQLALVLSGLLGQGGANGLKLIPQVQQRLLGLVVAAQQEGLDGGDGDAEGATVEAQAQT
jgi:hypothetical protein